jgi:hypothetical protein
MCKALDLIPELKKKKREQWLTPITPAIPED